MKIVNITAREILDSRGNPTIETTVSLKNGVVGIASVPSGASTGIHEALELRDGGKRYGGLGVLKAVENVNKKIASLLIGLEVEQQQKIDEVMLKMDGTKNKSKLGANAILSVSLACARAGAACKKQPLYVYLAKTFGFVAPFKLPRPMMNVINGGRHADSGLDVQEFMIVPNIVKNGQINFAECVRVGAEIFHSLKNLLHNTNFTVSVGDEGGFAPKLKNDELALEELMKGIKGAGYVAGKDVELAMDCAASEYFANDKYIFEKKKLNAQKISQIYCSWLKKYPLVSLEDPMAQDDWEGWKILQQELLKNKQKPLLVGDDLFVTNIVRLQKGITDGVANAILVKVNQIGTLSETVATIKLAKKNNYKTIISHRSGETADTFIADLAVAVAADFIKIGSLSRSERVEKYNRLMQIEKELKNKL